MATDEKDKPDQTEKELKHLIEKAQNENSALNKILKLFSNPEDQIPNSEPEGGNRKKSKKQKQ